jgi:PD-(D/E)XK nuclease superfamily
MLEVDDQEKRKLLHEETTCKIIGAALEVHDQLGYGFLERVYQRALQVELLRRGATAELEKRIQVHTKEPLWAVTISMFWSTAASLSKSKSHRNTTSEMKLSYLMS